MRRTVECEAIVFDLEVLTIGGDETVVAEPTAGARYLLGQLPAGRWALVTSGTAPVARHRLQSAGLPVPDVLVATDVAPSAGDVLGALESLGADPAFSVLVAGCISTLAAANGDGSVIAVASAGEPEHLGAADHVVPSLSSVRVLGQHPIVVLEVDTIPTP